VEKEHPGKSYYPHFVQVQRCGGSCHSHPSVKKCVWTTSKEVRIPLLDLDRSDGVDLKFKSHTACGCVCALSPLDCQLDVEKGIKVLVDVFVNILKDRQRISLAKLATGKQGRTNFLVQARMIMIESINQCEKEKEKEKKIKNTLAK